MAIATIHELLPIPLGTKQPHAYQIFGLELGEQDATKIKAAIQSTVRRLKEAKSTTDPKVWGQAARLVQQGNEILSDQEKKAKLDARFGIIGVATPAPSTASVGDPLAGVLPAADPLAALLPATNPLAPSAATDPPPPPPPDPSPGVPSPPPGVPLAGGAVPPPMPAGVFGASEPVDPAATVTAESESRSPSGFDTGVVVKEPTKAAYRRRKSKLGTLVFATFALAMIALIGGLGYFLFLGPGQLAIRTSNDGIMITTGPTEDDGNVKINDPIEPEDPPEAKPFDDVMGRLAGDVLPPIRPDGSPPRPERNLGSDLAPESTANSGSDSSTGTGAMTPDEMTAPATGGADTMEPEDPAPMTPVNPPEMTEAMIAEAETKIAAVAQLLGAAKWNEMKPAAEKLLEQPLSPAQKERAESLYQLADLASYYRGGIERGVGTLTVGNDFQVTDALRVIIVETGPDLLVIRYNAKNKAYTFDELPFPLSDKLAAFALPVESPTVQAARAAYQALAPKALPDHRQQAIDWLGEIEGEVEGADPNRVAETIRELFSGQ